MARKKGLFYASLHRGKPLNYWKKNDGIDVGATCTLNVGTGFFQHPVAGRTHRIL